MDFMKSMDFLSGQKKWVLVGILVIGGGAAFVFFDPLGLDLLGGKEGAADVKPVDQPHVAAPAAPPPAAAPKAAPAQANAPIAAPPAKAAAPASPPPPAATPVVAATVATPPAASPAQAMQPPLKLAKTIKITKKSSQPGMATSKPERAKNLDLRHCLELETDVAIAKCAGE
jgi:hypothetical protein